MNAQDVYSSTPSDAVINAHDLYGRTLWVRFRSLNSRATKAQRGAVSGDLHAIARFAVLADQTFDAQRAIYGFKGAVNV